jgi:hypothetical protein
MHTARHEFAQRSKNGWLGRAVIQYKQILEAEQIPVVV